MGRASYHHIYTIIIILALCSDFCIFITNINLACSTFLVLDSVSVWAKCTVGCWAIWLLFIEV